jgi:hypothetical protein
MLDSFLYQYLVGGLIFAFGIWCSLRTGTLSWTDPIGRRWLLLLVFGFLFFVALQGAFVLWGK